METDTATAPPTQADLEAMIPDAPAEDLPVAPASPAPTDSAPPTPAEDQRQAKTLAAYARREQALRQEDARVKAEQAALDASRATFAKDAETIASIRQLREEIAGGKPGAAAKLLRLVGDDPHGVYKTITAQVLAEKLGPSTADPKDIENRAVEAAKKEAKTEIDALRQEIADTRLQSMRASFVADTTVKLGSEADKFPHLIAEYGQPTEAAEQVTRLIETHWKKSKAEGQEEILTYDQAAGLLNDAFAEKAARYRSIGNAGAAAAKAPSASPFEPARPGVTGETNRGQPPPRTNAGGTLTQAHRAPAPASSANSKTETRGLTQEEATKRALELMGG